MVAAYPDVGPDSLSEDAIHKEVIVTHSSWPDSISNQEKNLILWSGPGLAKSMHAMPKICNWWLYQNEH